MCAIGFLQKLENLNDIYGTDLLFDTLDEYPNQEELLDSDNWEMVLDWVEERLA